MFDGLFHLLSLFAAGCLGVMVVLVFGNVVLRYAFDSGIIVSEELASWCLTWMTYSAGLVALRKHGHLGFDSFLKLFPAIVQRCLLAAANVLMIAIMGMFLRGSWQQTVINLETRAPASGLSVGALYGIGIVFAAIAILVLLGDLYGVVTGRLSDTTSSEAREALAEVAAQEDGNTARQNHGGKTS
jgi:TRAP-type C4-dicarboxylate transport system permease small subunit